MEKTPREQAPEPIRGPIVQVVGPVVICTPLREDMVGGTGKRGRGGGEGSERGELVFKV